MAPITIRLSPFEVKAILDILEDACHKCNDCNVRVETIVLAEFYVQWWRKRLLTFTKPTPKKDPAYKIPVSIVRILHYRLQHSPSDHTRQFILAKFDQALIDRNLRPTFPSKLL
jgi:hypothetical protein